MSKEAVDRALATVKAEAQPTKVVVADLAYARDARLEGQWTAGLRYAAPGALIHGRNGPVAFEPLFRSRKNPAQATLWSPRQVVMSCDATVAVSFGRFRDAEAKVGDYVTIWQRQPDGEYRWFYDVAGRDDPQPPPPVPAAPDEIVVEAWDAVQGIVADCPTREEQMPAPPAMIRHTDTVQQGSAVSPDGTFRWRWAHLGSGIKQITVEYLSGGEWRVATAKSLRSAEEI
ncbi:hypothetical protein OAS19_01645 [Altererythrobacter sp.]|nr:hypothetical protein [Altererythrobacter sp.]